MRRLILFVFLIFSFLSFSQTKTINSKVVIDSESAVVTDKILNVFNFLDESVFNVEVSGDVSIGEPTTDAKLHIKADSGNLFKATNSTDLDILTITESGQVYSNGRIDDLTNTVYGIDAGRVEIKTGGFFGFGHFNSYYGQNAGYNNTSGYQNTFIGAGAGFNNVSGLRNVCVGNVANVPQDGDGNDNFVLGVNTGTPILNGDRNVLIANEILGFSNALDNVSDAIFIGHGVNALGDTGTGGNTSVNEIVIGSGAVGNGSNTATFGGPAITDTYLAGDVHADSYIANGKTSDDILLGDGTTTSFSGLNFKFVDGTDPLDAVYNVSDGNVGVGLDVPTAKLHVKTDALTDDILIVETSTGEFTLRANDNGSVWNQGLSGVSNAFFGLNSGRFTTGSNNAFFGGGASNTTGGFNVAVGLSSGAFNTTASFNVFVGESSGYFSSTGSNNTCVGRASGLNVGANANNTYIGNRSGENVGIGSNNSMLGTNTGFLDSSDDPLSSLSNSVLIGQDARPLATGDTNEIVIGKSAYGNGSNTTTIGNGSNTDNYFTGKTHTTSSMQVGDDTDAASATNVGAIRYRADANNSYMEMSMQTGVSTYAWIIIQQNTW